MKKILVIGAGFLQSFLIKKAKELNYYVYTVDGNPNAVGFDYADESIVIDISDQKAVLKYAKSLQKLDGVVTAATDFGVMSTSLVAQELNLPGLDYEASKLIKNKYLVRKRLYDSGLDDSPKAFMIEEDFNFEPILAEVQYPVIVKPVDSSGSRGTHKVTSEEELFEACHDAVKNSLSKKALIESFITGTEYGVESFIYEDKVNVLSVINKSMTVPPNYAELGHAIPCDLNSKLIKKVKQYVTNAITELGINFGSVNMDIIIDSNDGVHIIDIGARMGGNLIGSHLIPIGTGIDYLSVILKASVGESFNICPIQEPMSITTKLLALAPGKIVSLPDFSLIEEKYSVKIYANMNLGDEINSYQTNLDGKGYIVAVSDVPKESNERACKALIEVDNNIERG